MQGQDGTLHGAAVVLDDLAEPRFSPAAQGCLADHVRGHLGRVDYRPESVGLDPAELRARFAPYSERFLGSAG